MSMLVNNIGVGEIAPPFASGNAKVLDTIVPSVGVPHETHLICIKQAGPSTQKSCAGTKAWLHSAVVKVTALNQA